MTISQALVNYCIAEQHVKVQKRKFQYSMRRLKDGLQIVLLTAANHCVISSRILLGPFLLLCFHCLSSPNLAVFSTNSAAAGGDEML